MGPASDRMIFIKILTNADTTFMTLKNKADDYYQRHNLHWRYNS